VQRLAAVADIVGPDAQVADQQVLAALQVGGIIGLMGGVLGGFSAASGCASR
jgi:hypothetical protein